MLVLCDGMVITGVDMDLEKALVGGRGVDAPNITVHIVLAGDPDISDARIQKHLLQFIQAEL